MIAERALGRDEIEGIWSIDRSEVIENIYIMVDGKLELRPDYFDMHGWPAREAKIYTSMLIDCYDRGGWFHGLFEDGKLIGLSGKVKSDKKTGKVKVVDLAYEKALHRQTEGPNRT
jgi:predicted N-acetyltransferase YhbS